jgi:GNAT superfamily N-acetyltransferase
MSNLQIVPATETDTRLLLDLIRELAEYEKLGHVVTATAERLGNTLFGARPAAEAILAYWDGECAGYAVCFPTYSTFLAQPGLYLEDLYVRPHLRGKGIGLELIRWVARRAIERGCGRMEWGVLDWNEPSIQFYRALGATAQDEWTKYQLAGEALSRLACPV